MVSDLLFLTLKIYGFCKIEMLNLKLNKLFKLLCRTFFVAAKGNKSFKWEKTLRTKTRIFNLDDLD